jgi:hypothetical protein
MQPSEKNAWSLWLEAIEHPNPQRTVLGFRGFSYKEKGLRLKTASGEIKAFLSPLLNRDISVIDEKMKNYVKTRVLIGDREKQFTGVNTETVVSLSGIMHSHTEGGAPSLFLSLSAEFDVAEDFVSGTERFPGPNGSLLAVRIDERRAFPDGVTEYPKEFELLVPLIVFPDEVVLFQENYDHSDAARAKFIKTLESRGENVESNGEKYYNGQFYSKCFEFFRFVQTVKVSP